MNVKTALNWASKKLINIPSNTLDAEILLAFVLKKDKVWLFTNLQKNISFLNLLKFKRLINKRSKYFPVAYLTNHKEFYGLDFKINKNVLVPRPLTEDIINKALKIIALNPKRPLTIADIGTGSGIIIISLAKKLSEQEDLNNFKFYASDISTSALKIAKYNAKKHNLQNNISFLKGSLLKPFKNLKIDLILTNLPYLTLNDFYKEKSIQQEPKIALIGNFYEQLFLQIKKDLQKSKYLTNSPKDITVIYEDNQGINLLKFSNPKPSK